MTYTVRHIGTVTVQAESEAALEAMLLSYWTPQSVADDDTVTPEGMAMVREKAAMPSKRRPDICECCGEHKIVLQSQGECIECYTANTSPDW